MHRVSATEVYTKNGSEGRFYVFFTPQPPQTWAFPVTPRAHVWCSVSRLELLQVTLRLLLRQPSLWNVNPRGVRLPLVLFSNCLSSALGSGQRVTLVSMAYLCLHPGSARAQGLGHARGGAGCVSIRLTVRVQGGVLLVA